MTDTTVTIPCHARTVRGRNEPVVFARDGRVFANSEDVAAYFGKQHSVVLRSIRTLISNDKSCACNFAFTSRDVAMPSGGTRPVATCDMTRDGFTLLAMGFTGKRALAWKLKYIEAFNAMEAQLAEPQLVVDDPPNRTRVSPKPVRRADIDRMDLGMDLLITAETALYADNFHDPKTIAAIRATIGRALDEIAPIRSRINLAA